jgi:transcriptional regulator with XRE-family HTH domain
MVVINLQKLPTSPNPEKRMSQGGICRAIGMDRSYMSAIESAKKNVTLAFLEKLANALSVSVDELLK